MILQHVSDPIRFLVLLYIIISCFLTHYLTDPNKTGPDGSSPIHWAARTDDRAEVIKSLLQYGADPNLQVCLLLVFSVQKSNRQ